MARSKETTPAAYLASLPPERREVISAVRDIVKKRLPKGYVESMSWGMLAYEIPLSRYPDTYNKLPLIYIALAAQKNNYAIYFSSALAKRSDIRTSSKPGKTTAQPAELAGTRAVGLPLVAGAARL